MERITPALTRAKSLFKKRLRDRTAVNSALARLEADPTGKGIARADVIIEAVVENLEIKKKIFADVESKAKDDAILATNTSSIELERIAEGLKDTSRLIGLHFFNPVAQLPLVEVIRSGYNVDADVARGASFALAIGKSPVLVKSAPGFLVNRVLMPYMITGSVVVDLYFSTGGIGQAFVNSALNRDYSTILGVTILLGALTIAGNLVVDVLYAWIDPKIRY